MDCYSNIFPAESTESIEEKPPSRVLKHLGHFSTSIRKLTDYNSVLANDAY